MSRTGRGWQPTRGVRLGQTGSRRAENAASASAPPSDVVDDELNEVRVAVNDDDVLDGVGGRFSWPRSLPRRPVAFRPGFRHRYPVAEALAGIGEVSVPAERG